MKSIIIWGNIQNSMKGPTGRLYRMLRNSSKKPKFMYGHDIMDVIVCTAANAFETNFAIYQNIGGKAVIIFTNCSKIAINRNKQDNLPGSLISIQNTMRVIITLL